MEPPSPTEQSAEERPPSPHPHGGPEGDRWAAAAGLSIALVPVSTTTAMQLAPTVSYGEGSLVSSGWEQLIPVVVTLCGGVLPMVLSGIAWWCARRALQLAPSRFWGEVSRWVEPLAALGLFCCGPYLALGAVISVFVMGIWE